MPSDEQGASNVHRAIWGVLAIGAGCVAYSLVKLAIAVAEPSVLQTPVIRPAAATMTQAAKPKVLYDFSFDPFHRAQLVAAVQSNIGEDAPETSLNIKLAGRTYGPNGGAILQTPDGKQARYAIGEEIVSGVTLKAVYKDYIALQQNGRIERLTIERLGDQSLLANITIDADVERVAASSPSRLPSNAKRVAVMNEAKDFLSQVRLAPVLEQGHVKGFKITPTNGSVKLSTYGLKSGDIITTVGSYDLTQGRPDMTKMMSTFQGQSSIDLTILRSGVSIKVKVNL